MSQGPIRRAQGVVPTGRGKNLRSYRAIGVMGAPCPPVIAEEMGTVTGAQAGHPTRHQGPDARQPKRNELERPANAASRELSDAPHPLLRTEPSLLLQNRPEEHVQGGAKCLWGLEMSPQMEQLSPPEH